MKYKKFYDNFYLDLLFYFKCKIMFIHIRKTYFFTKKRILKLDLKF